MLYKCLFLFCLLVENVLQLYKFANCKLISFYRSESFPGNLHFQSATSHFAHEGIIDAARELALQLDNFSEFDTTSSSVSIEGMNHALAIGHAKNLRKVLIKRMC